jgi:predicted metal-dependent hydrolase
MQQLEFLLAPQPGRERVRRRPETRCYLQLDGVIVPYLLRRSNRRSIGLTVDTGGLHVAAPQRAPLAAIEAFIRDNGKWVKRKLTEWARYRETLPDPWRVGDLLPFLGASLATRFEPGLKGARRQGEVLEIGASPADALPRWLKAEALPLFSERTRLYAGRLGVATPRLGLSNAETRWGTCSETGRVTLNWRLVHFALPVIDYVVVHELAHLIEMNHSHRFWEVVKAQLPDFEAARAELRARARQLPDI